MNRPTPNASGPHDNPQDDGPHDNGPEIVALTLYVRPELEVAWLHLSLDSGVKLEMDIPWYLSQVIKVHLEAKTADIKSGMLSTSRAGFRTAKYFARQLSSANGHAQLRTAAYVRECRQDLRARFKDGIAKAGHGFPPPRLFEFKPSLGTRIKGDGDIRWIPDPPPPQAGSPPDTDGDGKKNGPSKDKPS